VSVASQSRPHTSPSRRAAASSTRSPDRPGNRRSLCIETPPSAPGATAVHPVSGGGAASLRSPTPHSTTRFFAPRKGMRVRLDCPVLTSSTPATCHRPRRRSRVSRRLASLALATNRRPDTARERSRCIHSSRANAPSQCRTHHHRATAALSDTLRRPTDGGQHRTPTPPHPGPRDVTPSNIPCCSCP
jgi:hypothetical protein